MCDERKVVVIFSGGLDSTILLWYLRTKTSFNVEAFSVNYGQRHVRELEQAKLITQKLKIPHIVLELPQLRTILGGSALTSEIPVPHGMYDADNMKTTVVPNRNAILINLAVGYALSINAMAVYTAVHAGDHAVYPDCRPSFIHAMDLAIRQATENTVVLAAPFSNMSKTDIVGVTRGYPEITDLVLPYTWSCYEGGALHCGKCGTCVERIEAFYNAGVKDLTPYQPGGREYALQLLKEKAHAN